MNLNLRRLIIPIILAVGVIGGLFAWRSHYKPPDDRQVFQVHSPPPLIEGDKPPRSLQETKDQAVLLDKIAGASLQQVRNLLASRSSREIADLARRLQSLQPGSISTAKINLFFQAWSEIDAPSALQVALAFTGWSRPAALEAVIDGLQPAAAAALVSTLAQLSPAALAPPLKQHLMEKGILKWSQLDPRGAAAFLSSSDVSAMSPMTWNQVAESWASSDPASALDWIDHQTDKEAARTSMQGLISGWWQKDPAAAETYARSHTDTLAGQQMASMLANRMAANEPERAAEWASRLANQDARIMSELSVGVAWMETNPTAASRWVETLPDEDRNAIAGAVSTSWARNDPEAAARWISSLTGEMRDAAISGYTSSIAPTDPANALTWALNISNDRQRNKIAASIAATWLARQPDQARSWIQQSDLQPIEKARLLGEKSP
jgi:hypothetical protein